MTNWCQFPILLENFQNLQKIRIKPGLHNQPEFGHAET